MDNENGSSVLMPPKHSICMTQRDSNSVEALQLKTNFIPFSESFNKTVDPFHH